MGRHWLDPIVRLVQSFFDDSVAVSEYHDFIQSSTARLGGAIRETADPPAWAGEFRLALDNLKVAAFPVDTQGGVVGVPSYDLPNLQEASEWFEKLEVGGIIQQGQVERFTAVHLLTLLGQGDKSTTQTVINDVDRLMRHVELRRKSSIRLSGSSSPLERWYEIHDTAILFARAAQADDDLRPLNAAMKLNDWAYPTHRRSVPVELLVRYILAISEVYLACEELL